jgi:hypothetical protein
LFTYRKSNQRSNGVKKRLRDRVIILPRIFLRRYFKVKKPPDAIDARRIGSKRRTKLLLSWITGSTKAGFLPRG